MKCVILCGGKGTRLAEETGTRPKPLVDIGDRPILWHIMKCYAAHGISDFCLALGYKGEQIKDYFLNYHRHAHDISLNTATGTIQSHEGTAEDWNVTLVDTGVETQTGGRIRRMAPFLDDEPFLLTYGDGVCNVDISELVDFHQAHGKLATVTAVHPPARFGELALEGDLVKRFREKPQTEQGWINGGFFVLSPAVIDYVDDDETVWERKPLESLCAADQLVAYKHDGFWQCMDTLRDRRLLDGLWESGNAPWRIWEG